MEVYLLWVVFNSLASFEVLLLRMDCISPETRETAVEFIWIRNRRNAAKYTDICLSRKKCRLVRGIEMAGPVEADTWVSSSVLDTEFFTANLIEVYRCN